MAKQERRWGLLRDHLDRSLDVGRNVLERALSQIANTTIMTGLLVRNSRYLELERSSVQSPDDATFLESRDQITKAAFSLMLLEDSIVAQDYVGAHMALDEAIQKGQIVLFGQSKGVAFPTQEISNRIQELGGSTTLADTAVFYLRMNENQSKSQLLWEKLLIENGYYAPNTYARLPAPAEPSETVGPYTHAAHDEHPLFTHIVRRAELGEERLDILLQQAYRHVNDKQFREDAAAFVFRGVSWQFAQMQQLAMEQGMIYGKESLPVYPIVEKLHNVLVDEEPSPDLKNFFDLYTRYSELASVAIHIDRSPENAIMKGSFTLSRLQQAIHEAQETEDRYRDWLGFLDFDTGLSRCIPGFGVVCSWYKTPYFTGREVTAGREMRERPVPVPRALHGMVRSAYKDATADIVDPDLLWWELDEAVHLVRNADTTIERFPENTVRALEQTAQLFSLPKISVPTSTERPGYRLAAQHVWNTHVGRILPELERYVNRLENDQNR